MLIESLHFFLLSCSSNVGYNNYSAADGGTIAGAVIGVLLALAIIAAVTVGVVYLVWRTKFRASYPPPRYSSSYTCN